MKMWKRLVSFIFTILFLVAVLSNIFTISASAWGPDKFVYPMDDLSYPDYLVPSWEWKDGLNVFKDTGYDFVPKCEVNVYHNGYTGTSECDEILAKCYQTFLAWGMCPEGAVAVCGNIANESGGDPTAFGGGFAVNWEDERVLDGSGNYKGFKTMGQGGESVDFGMGLIEFTANVWIEPVFYIAAHEHKEWTDLGCQLLCLSYDYGPRNQEETPPQDTTLFKPFYDEDDDAKSLIGFGQWNNYTGDAGSYYGDLSADSENGKIARLTLAYMANCEVPAVGLSHLDRRIQTAQEKFQEWKDLEPVDYSNGGAEIGSKKSSGGESDGSYVLVDEWDLTGMPAKSGLVSDVAIPNAVTFENLSVTEQYNVVNIKDSIELRESFELWDLARVAVVYLGLLLMVYSLLLIMALVFDKTNNFIEFSLIGLLSFGGIKYSRVADTIDENGVRMLGTKRIVASCLIVFLAGCLLVSGGIFPIVMKFVAKVMATLIK